MTSRKDIIEVYKNHIREFGYEEEIYKWELIEKHKGKPNLETENLHNELKSINFSNLIYHAALTPIYNMARLKTKEYRACFNVLFDESRDLKERIAYFSEETLKLFRTIESNKKLSHHHDERTISTFLTFKYPDKYALYKNSFYKKYCELLEIKPRSKNQKYIHYLELIDDFIENYIKKDTELLELVAQKLPSNIFADENYKLLAQDILYRVLDGKIGKNPNTNYYVIGSKYGDNGDRDIFPLLLEKNVISTGFYGHKSLSDFYLKPKGEIINHLKSQGENSKSYSALKHFLNIKVGDEIAIKSDGSPKGKTGYLKIVAFAEVIEKEGVVYKHDKDLGHTLNVKFTEAPINLELELGGYGRTIHHLSNQNHISMIFDNDNYTIPETIHPNQKPIVTTEPLNQILFGPPGTGKTYQTRKTAFEIIKGQKPKDFEEALQLFKDLKGDQIEFITFHQNYSYEDFVQGLRPDVDAENQGLKFKKHNGIFYKISKRAKDNYLKSKNSTKDIEVSFDEVFAQFSQPYFKDGLEITVSMKSANFYITEITETHLKFRKQSGGTSHDLVKETLKGIYNGTREFSQQGLGVYYYPLIDTLKNEAESIKSKIKSEPLKNYVLIIDEINRANISRVFGELITLLEPSKRFGQEEELEVQLPSGDRFVVPSNLYVIGTMNTADKSIALLDIALRRRFDFVPVFPDKGLVDEKYRAFFDALNIKIADWKSPDFTIGHSYFMKIEDEKVFEKIMNNKVIPLLSEYFMNDLERVKSLLSEVDVKLKTEHYGILRFESIDLSKTQTNGND